LVEDGHENGAAIPRGVSVTSRPWHLLYDSRPRREHHRRRHSLVSKSLNLAEEGWGRSIRKRHVRPIGHRKRAADERPPPLARGTGKVCFGPK